MFKKDDKNMFYCDYEKNVVIVLYQKETILFADIDNESVLRRRMDEREDITKDEFFDALKDYPDDNRKELLYELKDKL